MKKFLLAIFSSIICLSLLAQEVSEINRLLVCDKLGNTQGFILDKVDYIEFEKVEGEVAANVKIFDVSLENVTLGVTRTAECESFKLTVMPTVRIASYSDDALASLIDSETEYRYYEDFESAILSGMELEPNTSYTVLTVGIDVYGVLCDVRKVEFTTPSMPLVGNPQVTVEEVDIQQYKFTLRFTPNADVSKFSMVAGEVGTLEQQYEMFAPMFGFSNIGQMIEMWGVNCNNDTTFTWNDMAPGTEYEVFIQAWDAAGTMAPHQVYTLTTTALGGEGVAEVGITLGEYKMADWWGEMLPSQFITFTPNDQVSAYRFDVYTADIYDAESDVIKAELCTEPPMPMTNWFFYESITTDYQINPNTECVVIAAAKNVNGEWGPITELRFTTPEVAAETNMTSSKLILKRYKSMNKAHQDGTLPVVKLQNKVLLKGK